MKNNFTFGYSTNHLLAHNSIVEKNNSAKNPLVSIIITSYNYGRYLADAVKSALNQTYPNVEIIIVDDGSTDNTKNVATLFPVKYIRQAHQGVAVARNNGIHLTHGEFFMCLDADDKLVPEYVETTLKQMVKHASTGFVYTGSKVWNETSELENIWMPQRILSKYSLFAGWMGAQGPMLVRREAFESLDHGYDPNFPAHEDLDVCFRLLTKGWKADLIYGPLHWYRVHPGSLNPTTPERKRITGAFMDRKFWFRRSYRMVYAFYQGTLGKVELLMMHPVECLKGIRKKTQINVKIKSYHWTDAKSQEKARQLQREIYLTTDMLVEWHRNKALRKYYKNRIRILESRLENLLQVSNM